MSGTPSPKTPCDWWSQCEIAWPGFLKEGSRRAMEERLAFMVEQQFDAGKFKKRIGWKDDERKCAECGDTLEEGPHELDGVTDPDDYHKFVPSTNRSRLSLRPAQRAGGHQTQEGLPATAREAIPQDRLQADRQHLARGRGPCRRGPQRRDGHDLVAGTERRIPVPRAAGRCDEMHALHGRHGRGMGGPGRSRGHVSGHRPAGPRPEGPAGQADGRLPSCAAASGKCRGWSASRGRCPARRMPP